MNIDTISSGDHHDRWWVSAIVIAIVVLIAYLFAPAIPPLLDEQFLLKWTASAGRNSAPLIDFLMWTGFDPADQWGPLTGLFNKISQSVAFGLVPIMRIQGIMLHVGTAVLLYLTARRLWRQTGETSPVPVGSAILFAAYPLNAEAVAWLGGRGLELAGAFFAGSLYSYLRARRVGEQATHDSKQNGKAQGVSWLIASVCLYGAALLSSSAIWSASLLFALFEIWFTVNRKKLSQHFEFTPPLPSSTKQSSGSETLRIVGPLVCIVITAAYVAGNGTLFQMADSEIRPDFSWSALFLTTKALLFPINESIWHKYAYAYDFLYVVFPLFIASFIFALTKSAVARMYAAFTVLWLLLSLIPEIGHISKENLSGARLFYISSMPFSVLLSSIFCSPSFLVPPHRKNMRIATGLAGVLILLSFYLAHITNQNMAWRNGGRQISAMQKSLSIIQSHTAAPYLLASDIPSWTAVSSRYAIKDIALFDGPSGLLSAAAVSPGHLKDSLAIARYKDVALNWNEDFRSFMPMDLSALNEPFGALTAKEIAARFVPAIEYFPTAHYNAARELLMLESNNDRGPAMRISADGLSPVKDDFLFIDASIEAPPSKEKPIIELYWQTTTKPDYDNKNRRVWTKAKVDAQFHRYYLSLRTPGWIDSGTLRSITLGFPAGARVSIKSMGTISRETISPKFTAVSDESHGSENIFDPPFYNFPNAPGLGLFTFGLFTPVTVAHDVAQVPGATGIAIEISMPDRVFPNPNGNEASGVGATTLAIDGVKGTYNIPTREFPRSGVYALRAIAIDSKHDQLGQFSDAIYCLVRKVRNTGWSEQLQ